MTRKQKILSHNFQGLQLLHGTLSLSTMSTSWSKMVAHIQQSCPCSSQHRREETEKGLFVPVRDTSWNLCTALLLISHWPHGHAQKNTQEKLGHVLIEGSHVPSYQKKKKKSGILLLRKKRRRGAGGQFPGLLNAWGISSVQSLRHVQLFVIPWTAVHQASLSISNSWSLLKLMSVESVMPSNHLILCRLLLLPSYLSQHWGLFQRVGSSHQVAKILEFQLQHQSFQWIFRTGFL